MKPLADFLPEVLALVPGCPYPVAINAVRNSAIAFLGKTNLLEQTVTIDLDPDETEAAIECDGGAKPVNFLLGYIGSNRVNPISPNELEETRPDWRNEVGAPDCAFIRNGALVVVPRPESVCSISATFSVSITRKAKTVEDVLYEDWLEAIASGALTSLMAMPGVPWSNPDLALYHQSRFLALIGEATVKRIKGSTQQSMRVTPRPFC